MKKYTKKELLYFLQENQITRVSYQGLLERHPDALDMLKMAYLMVEEYEMMPSLMEDLEVKINSKYFIFINPDNLPVLFEVKDWYYEKEYDSIIKRCGIESLRGA